VRFLASTARECYIRCEMDKIIEGVGWYIVFIFSLVVHEAAHAFTAWKLGDPTARDAGQVTLNPYPHIRREPFGTIVIPLITYAISGWMMGWGSAPYNPEWARQNPRRAMLMSFAGPGANLILVLLSFAVIRIGLAAGFFSPPQTLYFSHMIEASGPGRMDAAAFLVSVFFSLNLLLFIFNLLPIPPLDGSGIYILFNGGLGEKIAAFMRSPIVSFGGILVAWRLINAIYPTIQDIAIKILYPGVPYG
jgi:Zn-dependent protease